MRLSVYLPGRFQLLIGKILGRLLTPFMGSRAKIARRNIELCFPELDQSQQQILLKKTLTTMGMMMIETAMSWWASDNSLLKRVRYEGLEHLEQAKARGKGVILLTGHFTSMELGGRLIMLKTPAYVMFRHLKNRLFNAVMMRSRTFHSEGIVLRDDPRSMLRALKKNKVVWYAPDQDFGQRTSVFAKFFGVQAATIPATARMVKMSGASIVPFVPRREADGSYTITPLAMIWPMPSGSMIGWNRRYVSHRNSTCGCTVALKPSRKAKVSSTKTSDPGLGYLEAEAVGHDNRF